MKLKLLLLTVFVAGLTASIAIAKPPPGHGNPHDRQPAPAVSTTGSTTGSTTTTASTTTTTTAATTTTPTTTTATTTTATTAAPSTGKVLVCHKTGHGWVLISVSVRSAPAKGKHGGDVVSKDGTCPGPVHGRSGGSDESGGSTTTTTTPTTTTTTAATTTTTTSTTTGTTTTTTP